MAPKPDQIPDEKEAEDRFNKALERLVNTPHKPHKPPPQVPKKSS